MMDQDYIRTENLVKRNLQTISRSVSGLQQNVDKLGTHLEVPDTSAQVKILQTKTADLIKDTNNHLQRLLNAPPLDNKSEERQRKLQNDRHLQSFNHSLQGFQAAQKKAAQVEKEQLRNSAAQQEGSSAAGGTYTASAGQIQLTIEQHTDLSLIRERDEALKKLESDITDINTIMKDLSQMVGEQGEVIDSIEANVETTQVKVEDGRKQLEKAHNSQKSARRRKLIIAAIISVIIVVVVICIVIALSV